MEYQDLIHYLEHVGKDPSRLIFEDELTGVYNRRFLFNYFQSKVVWDALEDRPLSVIMLDVDHFKSLNDKYGHQIGDQALTWVAGLLKELAGEEGLAIRYAGDEFIILLPFGDNQAAVRLGERVLQRVRQEPVPLDGRELYLSLSMGIASAPKDAQSGKGLIHKADTALYYAKKSGRDRLANARDVALEEVFAKTAFYQLEEVKLVGRREQLTQVSEALKKFSQRQSQFLIVEGAPGMGKSEFLEAIRHNLAKSKVAQVKVDGVPQEIFRPYYLTTNILVSILTQRQDKGAEVFDSLSPKEVAYLAQILPQLGVLVELPPDEDQSTQREGIFNTLVHFIPKIVNSRPLIMFIDDLQYVDEATLMLIRRLMLRGEIPLFICATSSETEQVQEEEQTVPLERFYSAYHQELGILKTTLTPLSPTDIGNHIRGIFPNVGMPENFQEELGQISQGNPLFLSEILHKLIQDQKISLFGQQWVIEHVDEGYLPRSLEEIVTQKISALDEESRQLLDHVSAWGENISLSALVGSSDIMEARVQEFVDRAADQGLLSKEFHLNDEAISFISKRILDITYGSIGEDRKQELHERIGNYQETLYNKKLLPSAATLAYHFRRSADRERARKYEQFLAAWKTQIFNAQEAVNYTGELAIEFPTAEAPLDSDALSQMPSVLRLILGSLRNIKLYPAGSESVVEVIRQLQGVIDLIVEKNEWFVIEQKDQALVVNNEKIDVTEFNSLAGAFLQFMSRFELRAIAFQRDLSGQDLGALLEALGRVETKMIDQGFWKRFSAEQGLTRVYLDQVRYAMKGEQAVAAVEAEALEQAGMAAPDGAPSPVLAIDEKLSQEELSQIPEIIRSLLRAARTIRLYPEKSKAISESIQQLMETLQGILTNRAALALARVRNSLLVNGAKVDTSDFEVLASTFMKFLHATQISSLTFMRNITIRELETFIQTFGKLSPANLDAEFWRHFAEDNRVTGILFNQHLYDMLEEIKAAAAGEGVPEPEAETAPEETFETFLENMQDRLPDLLLKGDEKTVRQMIERLFEGFKDRDPSVRERVIDTLRSTLEGLTLAAQHQLSQLVADPLIAAFSEETEPKILVEIATLLQPMAISFILFAEYTSASRLLYHLKRSYRQLDEARDEHAPLLLEALDIELEPATQKLIVEDLKSSDSSKQKEAAKLLGSLGQAVAPLLIDVVKRVADYRVRKIATFLLGKLGPEAAEALKRELVLEISPEERFRILEVIDTLTRDLKNELPLVLGDQNPQVRKAAFQLAERLNDGYVVELLLDYAKNPETSVATAAIQSLGRLKISAAVGDLLSLMGSTKEEERIIACCRALGQIGDRSSVEPLAKLLARRSRFSFRKKHSNTVRTAAASALGQISHPRVAQVLASFVEDPDPRIRQIAQSVVGARESSPPS